MAKTETENISKMDLKSLFAQKKSLETQRYQQLVSNVSQGKKNSIKSIELKRKIAQVETVISQKLQDILLKKGANNE